MKTLAYRRRSGALCLAAWLVSLAPACGGDSSDASGTSGSSPSGAGASGNASGASASGSAGSTSGTDTPMSGASTGDIAASGGGTSPSGSDDASAGMSGGTTGSAATGASGTSTGSSSGAGTGATGATGPSGSSSGIPEAGVPSEASSPADTGFGTPIDAGPPYTGTSVAGTVTVDRSAARGRLGPAFAGLSFEKTHMSDKFFTGSNAPLIALFKLLGSSIVRIGANDVDMSTWVANAPQAGNGITSKNIGTADVDDLAAFLTATGWKTIYGVSMKTATAPSAAEAKYAQSKLGASLHSIEIGNEINFFGNWATEKPVWESFATAIRAQAPNVPLAGPAAFSAVPDFTVPFAQAEASKLTVLTEHYYRGASANASSTMALLLTPDTSIVGTSQTLANAARTNNIADGFRWGEMNSYSGHGKQGVSDAFGSALWGIDFMLTTAEYGSTGVNFHSGGQNMDGNTCNNGVSSCTKPFRYSPIDEVDSKVTGAAPLFYGMLLVSRAGVGSMYPTTTATANKLNFTGYTITLADGSSNIVLVNKDSTSGINASVDNGAKVTSASAVYLRAPALTSASGVTFAGAGISAQGTWTPTSPSALTSTGNTFTVVVPPASAVLVHVD